ncbi:MULTISPECIES: hypothetical protein [unclassified Modicisalibacter]|uniref:hypothetical protein n=1 Tax=unclassified Modicisalibacter TaxID=2679913 RepID=UPI001CCD1407|nr:MULTISPECIES: hypothetical protein [unclassified Modicisalibacter]MBZ9560280.1 hypothetical protein [Modicisalibacter sp. R2A 31.J]MBZ9576189.1 hypothetical protein [Modicisalibacter sp. MOD 31.J]
MLLGLGVAASGAMASPAKLDLYHQIAHPDSATPSCACQRGASVTRRSLCGPQNSEASHLLDRLAFGRRLEHLIIAEQVIPGMMASDACLIYGPPDRVAADGEGCDELIWWRPDHRVKICYGHVVSVTR